MNRPLPMFVLFVILLAGAVQGQENAKGPRLSDAELLASLDPNFAGLNQVIAARDAGQTSSALSALAGFVRTRQEPADSAPRARRNPQGGTTRPRES